MYTQINLIIHVIEECFNITQNIYVYNIHASKNFELHSIIII